MVRLNCNILYIVFFCCTILFLAIFYGYRWLNFYCVQTRFLANADAIVLMAGHNRDRLPAVVDLYRQGVAPVVFLTNDGVLGRWHGDESRNLYQAEWTQRKLVQRGVPSDAIVMLGYTKSGTFYDALNTKAYVQDRGIGSLIIVTSDYHTRRTLWSFEKVFAGSGVELGIYPTNSSKDDKSLFAKAVRFKALLIEVLKLNYYKLRHGVLRS